jgi:serine/threonine-protein kinase
VIGKILGNRYRLIELIGEGGMALVYQAEDSLLCRTVAVKILRPQYANDSEFVDRFRREARAAASLAHPSVVNIFDVGQEDGMDYIVMEYIPGANLKSIIKKEAPLPVERALEITRQIASALNHAHQRNIIHRDIKPHNILITPDGQVKVTDFGIARAVSASSFTQTGMVVGSVHYASPEQVRGGLVGPQSDLYSLGCVLYEMLTAKVPFSGDTSIAIALQHLQGEAVPIGQLRPETPPEVVALVEKAMAVEPSDRYPTALAMLKEVTAAQLKIQREAGTPDAMEMPTEVWSGVTPEDLEKGKERKWLPWVLLGFGGSFLLVLIVALFFLNVFTPPRPEVRVPSLVGKEYNEARQLLAERKLKIKIVNRLFNSDYPSGYVVSQRPEAGQPKRINTEIEVVLSKGPQLVRVPRLVGKTQLEAELALEEAGLKLGEILSESNPDAPQGTVIKQLPAESTQIEQGASVSITLNITTTDLVQVPNFIGRPLSEVRAELGSIGLIYNQATLAPSDIYPEGVVIDQKPVPFERVATGTAMNFIVSSGSAVEPTP